MSFDRRVGSRTLLALNRDRRKRWKVPKRYWITYWDSDSRKRSENNTNERFFEHTAGNGFKKRGVSPGDAVYVVSMSTGSLLLGGKMIVDKVVDRKTAMRIKKDKNLYLGDEHLIGVKGKSTPLNFRRQVPLTITKRLRFVSETSPLLKFIHGTNKLDNQTLRAVRELTKDSAIRLDHFMEDTDGSLELDDPAFIQPFEDRYEEGEEKLKTHLIKERNRTLVKIAKERWRKFDPLLHCDVCNFSFVETYGGKAVGYIEAHHTTPLASLKTKAKVLIKDLAKVCANCHRMLHMNNGCISVKQLRAMLRSK